MTMSSDGTAHKNIQYLSRHVAIIPPNDDAPKDFFIGITPEVNHTTNTQFEGWKTTIHDLCEAYNKCPIGSITPEC